MIPRFKPWIGWSEFTTLFGSNINAVQIFEAEFAKTFQAVDAIAFPYGRSAQWAFFRAIGLVNAEIIMPAYTCSVVAHAVTLSGNTPRFIDISFKDYNMDLDLIEPAFNPKTRAIIATHTFGYPQNLDRLESIVRNAEKKFGHKIWLIQDCCHAFGAKWEKRLIGTSGDVAVYAFNISKIMTSIFGGMLTFQDKTLADKVRKWRDRNFNDSLLIRDIMRRLYLLAVYVAFNKYLYGLTWRLQEKTKWLNRLTNKYHLDDKIHFPPDFLENMLDVEAAVGLQQLIKYPEIIKRRINTAKWYNDNLKRPKGWVFPPIIEGATYSHYVILVPDKKRIVDEFTKNKIQLGEIIQYSIPELHCYKKFSIIAKNADLTSKSIINLPIYIDLKDMLKIKYLTKLYDERAN